MRLLICGDRYWNNLDAIRRELLLLQASHPIDLVIEGEARGADSQGRDAALELGIATLRFPADWRRYGRAAGFIRNQQMLNAKPDYVLAFHANIAQSKGTKHMVNIAQAANIPVKVVTQ